MGEYCNGIVLGMNTPPDSDVINRATNVLTNKRTIIRDGASYDECSEQLYYLKKAEIAFSARNKILVALGLPFLDCLKQTPPQMFHELLSAFRAVHAVLFLVDDSFSYGAFALWEGDTLIRQYASDDFGDNTIGMPFAWEAEGTHPGDLALMATEIVCGVDVISFAMQQDDFTLLRK